jgi:hypothetical protein
VGIFPLVELIAIFASTPICCLVRADRAVDPAGISSLVHRVVIAPSGVSLVVSA